jgi:leucyl aminopeptidase
VFSVRAWDAADHVDPTEATRTFVVDSSPPAVALTAPAGGTTVAGTIMLGARARDDLTHVTRVKWFLDGVEVATDATGEPWEKAWSSARVANGTHKLVGKARDVAGNWGASRSILITVANG